MSKPLRYGIALAGIAIEIAAIVGLASEALPVAAGVALIVVGLALSFAPVLARRAPRAAG